MNPAPQTMTLAVPDWAEFDTVARRAEPPVLWPVGAQPLLAHWMDEARRRGVARVSLHCPDRPPLVRAWLEGGAYWSCPVEVLPTTPARIPAEAERTDRLPGEESPAAPHDGASLVRWWLARNLAWLASRETHARLLDQRHPEGGWIGPRARVHPAAKLVPPFWIGAAAEIGPRAQVGPGAIIGARCVIDAEAGVCQSVVLDDTLVGPHVGLHRMLADGAVVIDAKRGCRVEITESFILASATRRHERVPWHERLLAFALWLPAQLLALGRPLGEARTVVAPRGALVLRERTSGPLLARRAAWLSRVIRGELRLVGPLPRVEAACAGLPADAANLLRSVRPGVFSIADVHGCHVSGEGEEPVHALFAAADPTSAALVLRKLPRLLLLAPA